MICNFTGANLKVDLLRLGTAIFELDGQAEIVTVYNTHVFKFITLKTTHYIIPAQTEDDMFIITEDVPAILNICAHITSNLTTKSAPVLVVHFKKSGVYRAFTLDDIETSNIFTDADGSPWDYMSVLRDFTDSLIQKELYILS